MTIIEYLNQIEDWKSNEDFLRDAVILSSANIIEKCKEDVEANYIITIPPLLRQVQENLIVIIGLVQGDLTLEKFLTEEHNPKDIMKAVRNKKTDENLNDFDQLNEFLLSLKEVLNKFSHTNFDGIMTLFTERFQVYEVKRFNKTILNIIICLLEVPLIVIANDLYDLKIEIPSTRSLNYQLKNLDSLRNITRFFPNSIKDFINSSDILRDYYIDRVRNLKDLLCQFKDIQPKGDE